MTTGLTYTTYVAEIARLAATSPTNDNFVATIPQMITYAENRMCRDLAFMQFSDTYTGVSLTAGSRNLVMPEGTFVTIEQLNIITPVGVTDPDASNAVRNPCLPVTKEFLDLVCGSSASADRSQPIYFAPFNDNFILVGPVPDQAYGVEVVGMNRPASLSVANPETFISKFLPDLFIMASMIYISAFQRNFGRQSDDPQMAQSYEGQYQLLLKGAQVEEARKQFESAGWTSMAPASVATPTRG